MYTLNLLQLKDYNAHKIKKKDFCAIKLKILGEGQIQMKWSPLAMQVSKKKSDLDSMSLWSVS